MRGSADNSAIKYHLFKPVASDMYNVCISAFFISESLLSFLDKEMSGRDRMRGSYDNWADRGAVPSEKPCIFEHGQNFDLTH